MTVIRLTVVDLPRPDTGSGTASEASEKDGPVSFTATLPAMGRKGQGPNSGHHGGGTCEWTTL